MDPYLKERQKLLDLHVEGIVGRCGPTTTPREYTKQPLRVMCKLVHNLLALVIFVVTLNAFTRTTLANGIRPPRTILENARQLFEFVFIRYPFG